MILLHLIALLESDARLVNKPSYKVHTHTTVVLLLLAHQQAME